MTNEIAKQISNHPSVQNTGLFQKNGHDRLYINIKGNGGSFSGEKNFKLWLDNSTGTLFFRSGKGRTSREFDDNFNSFCETFNLTEV